jgi:cytochrome c oxidase assembly protein subunit 15
VSLHLLFGFITTALLWLLYFKLADEDIGLADQWRFTKSLRSLISFASVIVFLQIFLGAWTSTNYAAFSCTDFPFCQGEAFPNMNFLGGFNLFQDIGPNYLGGQMDLESRTAIHFTHRIGALVVSLFLSFLAWKIYKDNYKRVSLILMGLLLAQILLGVSNIIFQLPLLTAVAHNLGGLSLITYLMVLRFRYQNDN